MKRILFIGNSYTGCNNLPDLVTDLAKSAGLDFETESITRGGAQLKWHFSVPETVGKIKQGSWHYVILQDQSLQAVDRPAALHSAVSALADVIKTSGAVPVLYMTWARQHKPEMQAAITREYTLAAETTSSMLAPVGEAWRLALAEIEGLVLHDKDQSHPNILGSYLAACVILSTIAGHKAAELTDSPPPTGPLASLNDNDMLHRLSSCADKAIDKCSK